MGVSLDGLSDDALTASQDSAQRIPTVGPLGFDDLASGVPRAERGPTRHDDGPRGTLKSARRLPANSSTLWHIDLCPRTAYQHGPDLLPHHLIGYADDGHFGDGRASRPGMLHFNAVDVLAARVFTVSLI